MKTVQVGLDTALLKATGLAAKRRKVNRSALIRDALRESLRCTDVRKLEELDRRGYQIQPQTHEKSWDAEAVWPER